MVTAASPVAPPIAKGLKALRRDFQVLGLAASESRIEVIRQAAVVQTQLVKSRDSQDESVADIVFSTYRLLDPRRRRKLLERVQLSLMMEMPETSDGQTALLPSLLAPTVHPERQSVREALVSVELVSHGATDFFAIDSIVPPPLASRFSNREQFVIRHDVANAEAVAGQNDEATVTAANRSETTLAKVVHQVQQWAEAIWCGLNHVRRAEVTACEPDARRSRTRDDHARV